MRDCLPNQKRQKTMLCFAKRLRETYFSTLTPYPGNEAGSHPFKTVLGLIDKYKKYPEDRKNIFSKIELLMAENPDINNHSSLEEGELKGLACTALDEGLTDLAIYFINGEDKKTKEEAKFFYEREARFEGSHVWSDFKETEAINPKNSLQKAMLLMMYGTNEDSFGMQKDLAAQMIKECNINPHQVVQIQMQPQYNEKSDIAVTTPFMYFLQKNAQASKKVCIPQFNSNFYNGADVSVQNFEGESLVLALINAGQDKLAADVWASSIPTQPQQKKEPEKPINTQPEQPDLFGFEEPTFNHHNYENNGRNQRRACSSATVNFHKSKSH